MNPCAPNPKFVKVVQQDDKDSTSVNTCLRLYYLAEEGHNSPIVGNMQLQNKQHYDTKDQFMGQKFSYWMPAKGVKQVCDEPRN